uniref:Uncharacterized protein n=1 Tax=Micrurus lemniscatus lemniscatus TaxID=129467 RepID=A0A2D4JLU6_MICLE
MEILVPTGIVSQRLTELEVGKLPSQLEVLHKPENKKEHTETDKRNKEHTVKYVERHRSIWPKKEEEKRSLEIFQPGNRLGRVWIVEVQDIKHVLRKDKETAEKFNRLLASVLTAGEV